MANIRPLYDCVVMLDGSHDNQVCLDNVTAAELNVIRVLHGTGGVNPIVSFKATGKGVDRSDEQERARIAQRYSAPGTQNGLVILNSLVGVGNKLPLEYAASEPVTPYDDALEPEAEEIVDLKPPEAPITSPPEPRVITNKKTATSVLDDAH